MVVKSQLSENDLKYLDVAARVSACLSLAGAGFTITSYLSNSALRKPFNRLAFFIAISNAFGCLAYSWGAYPLYDGRTSPFCQAQGFLIEWLVMTDPLLVLTMAASVWFRTCTQSQTAEIVRIENIGVGCAFLLPFIPALVFLCWRPNGLTVYGPAGLWCWISNESNTLRISAFYGPIWLSLLLSMGFFFVSGKRILHVRAKVRRAQTNCAAVEQPRKFSVASFAKYSWRRSVDQAPCDSQPTANEIEFAPPIMDRVKSAPGRFASNEDSAPDVRLTPSYTAPAASAACFATGRASDPTTFSRRASRFDAMHWKYSRFAILCCLVLLITWGPISAMRMYNNFVRPDRPIIGLYYASAVCIPLQGFGNFVVYITNNWPECRAWISGLLLSLKGMKRISSVSTSNER